MNWNRKYHQRQVKKLHLCVIMLAGFLVSPLAFAVERQQQNNKGAPAHASSDNSQIPPDYSGRLLSLGRFSERHPLPLARDGDVRTWAWPESKKGQKDKGPLAYTVVFEEPETVSHVRFWQHPWCYATAFRIQADTTGDGQYDLTVLEVDDPLVKTGQWAQYSFPAIQAHAVRWEAVRGLGLGMSFPALAEIDFNDRPSDALPAATSPLTIMVEPDAVLNVGGVTEIPPAMFNLCWGAVDQRPDIARKYLEPLNLGELTVWGQMWGDRPLIEKSSERPISVVLPEDPAQPGHFDREFFVSGAYREWFVENRIRVYEEAKAMGMGVCEMLGKAPPYMQRSDFKSSATGKYQEETQFFPPRDPVEWGKLVGYTIREINEATGGAVKRGYIWNEPNASRYLPVPWRDKAETYFQLFEGAVPEIRTLNPEIEIGGPVLTGAGPLGWGDGHSGWETWAKPFIERCGHWADFYDAHSYFSDIDNLYAESGLIAGYSLQQWGSMLPLASTEAAPHLGTQGVKELDEVALNWRNGAMPTATILLKLLDAPEKWVSYARFYYKGWQGLSIFDNNDHPEPTYWVYWVLRNLRGQRLVASCQEKDLVVVATRQDGQYVIAVQNLSQEKRSATLDLPLPDAKTGEASIDYLEYDTTAGEVVHGTRQVAYDGQSIRWELKPLGLYAVTLEVSPPQPVSRYLLRREYFGDQFFPALPAGASQEFVIEVPANVPGQAKKTWLTFGTTGSGELREDRPRVTFDYRVPLTVELPDGCRYVVEAGKWNELEIDLSRHKGPLSVAFRREELDPDNPLQVSPEEFWLMSVSLVTEHWE